MKSDDRRTPDTPIDELLNTTTDEMPVVGAPLPVSGWDGGERRVSRRTGMHKAFRAIKAQHALRQTRMDTVASWLTDVASSTAFFVFHVIAFAGWIVWNTGVLGFPKFDPFPFGLLTMLVSLEAIFLATFVLMTQKREATIAEVREELMLQVNLRIEEEVTKSLHLVSGLYTRLGKTLGDDPELQEMLRPLDPTRMEREVMDQLATSIPKMNFRRRRVEG